MSFTPSEILTDYCEPGEAPRIMAALGAATQLIVEKSAYHVVVVANFATTTEAVAAATALGTSASAYTVRVEIPVRREFWPSPASVQNTTVAGSPAVTSKEVTLTGFAKTLAFTAVGFFVIYFACYAGAWVATRVFGGGEEKNS